jgi:hypothetical protein
MFAFGFEHEQYSVWQHEGIIGLAWNIMLDLQGIRRNSGNSHTMHGDVLYPTSQLFHCHDFTKAVHESFFTDSQNDSWTALDFTHPP